MYSSDNWRTKRSGGHEHDVLEFAVFFMWGVLALIWSNTTCANPFHNTQYKKVNLVHVLLRSRFSSA